MSPRHHRLLGCGRLPRQAQTTGNPSLVQDPVLGQRGFLAVVDDGQPGGRAVGERVPHQRRVRHWRTVVAEPDGPRLCHLPHVGQLLAGPALSIRTPIGSTRASPACLAASHHMADDRRVVHGGLGVRHGADGREPRPERRPALPSRSSPCPSCPGSRRCTCRSMNPGVTTSPVASTTGQSHRPANAGTRRHDHAVGDQHVAHRIDALRGVDDPPAL